jgi:ethylmalonyl-CoA/methylmalonyl-CoA decarboxylase
MSLLPTDPLSITSEKLRSLGQGEVIYNASFAPGVALIELRHGERHNSFSGKMMAQFRDIILRLEQLSSDSDLVAVIMTGCAGKSFCSGIGMTIGFVFASSLILSLRLDLAFAQEHMQGDAKEAVNRFMHDTLTRFSRLSLITVASMAGAALGGGTELLTAFDYICMDSGTFIRFVQTRMGVSSPWGGARRLVPRIGRKHALRILGSAPVITAAYGLEVGLVDTIVDSGSKEAAYGACLQACLTLVEPFIVDQKSNDRVSPAAVRGMKQLVVRSEDPSDIDYEMFLFNSVVGSSRL